MDVKIEDKRYIDVEELYKKLDYEGQDVVEDLGDVARFGFSIRRVKQIVESLNPISLTVKYGTWVLRPDEMQEEEHMKNGNYYYECSICHHGDLQSKSATVPFCWNCGSRMKKQ